MRVRKLIHSPELTAARHHARGWRERGWRCWLFPRPYTVASTVLCVLPLLATLADPYPFDWWGHGVVVISACTGILLLDRLDVALWGACPPVRLALLSLALRGLMLSILGLTVGPWFALWPTLPLPYLATMYLGIWGGVASAVGLGAQYVGIAVWSSGLPLASQLPVESLVFLALALSAAVGLAAIVRDEQRGREELARVQTALEHAHHDLQGSAAQELRAVEDRTQFATAMYGEIQQALLAVRARLHAISAHGERKSMYSARAIGEAKHLVGTALATVRSSIQTLRAPAAVPDTPAATGLPRQRLAPLRGFELLPLLVYAALFGHSFRWDMVDPQLYT